MASKREQILAAIKTNLANTTGVGDRIYRSRVEPIARGETPENVGDATIESLHTKILNDPTVGGLAKDIRPATQTFEFIDSDSPVGLITCEYEIEYRTSYNNLAS